MELKNHTQFTVQHWLTLSPKGAKLGNVLIKGQFNIRVDASNSVTLSGPIPAPILAQDTFFGEPNESSVRVESDFSPLKPTTDITANATAYAPNQAPLPQWTSGIHLEGLPPAMLNVYGPRHWERVLMVPVYSEAEPCTHVPIRFENAFGGYCAGTDTVSEFNPIGKGLLPVGEPLKNQDVHQLEWADHRIDETQARKPQPAAGFGVCHRSWQPRLSYAGTYDKAWLENHHPLLPQDFDRRHYLAGCERLRPKAFLKGGESITFIHLDPHHPVVAVTVPKYQFLWEIQLAGGEKGVGQCHLDTLHFDIEQGLHNGVLTAIWKGVWPAQELPKKIRAIQLRSKGREKANG
ncbi:DUF2169 family type VI secretion system accessory protein [Vibrio mimicus]|uniref:DUF2169 family type VI secretion system accessory protein n=1 Tax=Vibrio mimicus TaxID=674 RepID=UPI0001BAE1B2|nr:DUF2169 domain-containing protein [Vibrio mimicus]EEY46527.1 hypothetical protein VMA_000086 [Vibrio mimicus VM223]